MAIGDQIYVYRTLSYLDIQYEHHGIDCGDRTVIHYRKPSETIEETSLETFSLGNPVYVRNYSRGFTFVPEVVVQRAYNRLGEHKYDLLFNNCEHFATWCKTGISDSSQVRQFLPLGDDINVDHMYESVKTSLGQTDSQNAQTILKEALDDIKVVWNRLQPEYKKNQQEIESWQKVAKLAVEKNRDDLAKAALERKLGYQKRQKELEAQLQQVASMTETLLRNFQIYNS